MRSAKSRWVALSTLFVLAGCGTQPSSSNTPGTLDTQHPFLIASPRDATGADASVGQFWSAGLDVAAEKINASGGILGRKVVIDYKDTQSDPVSAAQIANTMLSSGKYQALIPTASASQAQPIMQAVKRAGILSIFPGPLDSAADPKQFPTIFDPGVINADTIGPLTCLMLSKNPKSVGFLYIDIPNAVQDAQLLTQTFQQKGIAVVANEKYQFAATDITPQVQKIKRANPDALFFAAYFNAVATGFRAMNALDYSPQIYGDQNLSAAPASAFLASTTHVPPGTLAMLIGFDTRINGVETDQQKSLAAAVLPRIGGKFPAVLSIFLIDYDALMLVKWAAENAHSDKTADMVKALETLGANPQDTGAVTGVPGFSPTFHGYSATKEQWQAVDITGDFVDGTFKSVRTVPATC
jgi:ABC-type branched-subunit amino acid transport system substrate-binding protein